MENILIVGGGLAAARTCASLRKLGYAGALTLVSEEDRPPYDRPPLSKAALAGPVDTTLNVDYADLQVTLRLGVTATSLDLAAGVVGTDHGDIPFDGLVIASGSVPIMLPGDGPQFAVRTAEDSEQLAARLVPGAHVVLVGASWIGAEVATAALKRGCTVTCVDIVEAPLAQAIGTRVGQALAGWWEGVELRLGIGVHSVTATGITLADGSTIAADVVVTGVGVRPAIGWLVGSGLELDGGVVVDDRLRTSAANVVAVGDVAVWWSGRWQQRMRIMHWDDAASGPATAAAALLAGAPPADAEVPSYDPVPYFWSDQFGHKLQYVGHHTIEDEEIWRHDPDTDALVGVGWVTPEGELSAYLSIDRPRDMLQGRMAITKNAKPDPALLADGAVPIASA